MPRIRRITALVAQLALAATLLARITSANTNGGRDRIKAEDLKEWLTYLASDGLEGRATFTEGLGLAAAYIAGQLKSWGVKPGGDNGSYFQRVAVLGVKSTKSLDRHRRSERPDSHVQEQRRHRLSCERRRQALIQRRSD